MQIWRCVLAHEVRWVTLSVQGSLVPLAPLPLTRCEGRGGCAGRVGDYQIAPIAARSTAMGRWRLTPPGYGGTYLPAGRSARGSDRPPACHSTPLTHQGGRLGGASFNGAKPSRGRLGRCGGRREKHLPWLRLPRPLASATVGVFASTGLAIIKSRLCRLAAAKVGVPVGHRI